MNYPLKPLEAQVVVITGASSGIGFATSILAFDRGAKLVLASRSEHVLDEMVRFITENGGDAMRVVADVSERVDMERVASEAMARYGRIDTWVNNAGVSIYGKLDEVSEADHRRLFDVNFWGVVNGSFAALPHLKAHGGALINVGSEVSDAVVPLQGMYSASKHAVKGFTDALRVELLAEESPVSVTLIQPTAVNTPYPEHARNYLDREPKLPSPQIEPRHVAQAILRAAERPERAVKVGAMAKLNTTAWQLTPALAERVATSYIDKQNYDSPPIAPEGTLYQAGETGRPRGRPPEARQ